MTPSLLRRIEIQRIRAVLGILQHPPARLRAEHRLEIVPGATHLFEEPGTLEAVAELACRWFQRYLRGHDQAAQQ